MGLLGDIFGSSKKTTNDPWKAAQPYILKGMDQTNQVFDENQPRLADMSTQAYQAFNAMAPGAFGQSPYVKNAQNVATGIGSGGLLGTNAGQSTYDRLMGGGAPASGGMASKAGRPGGAPGAMFQGGGDPSMGIMAGVAAGGVNPATGAASNVSGGGYLNGQPSAGMYAGMMSDDYSTKNPYIDAMAKQAGETALTNTNRLFASRGMGAGISSPYAGAAAGAVANAENSLRYGAYNDAENRRLQAGGQSDAAWSGERGRMDAATGLLSDNYNANQNRTLAAAQALGSQFNAGQDRSLAAAQASDSAQSNQVQQMLQALGLTGELRNADYAGVTPALSLLNTAADLPYVGVGALNGNIRQASNGYGTSTTTSTPSLAQAAGQTLQFAAAASDRRLKTNIERVGTLPDGLGVYDWDYTDPKYGEGRHRGVMADEVATLRPWALGPTLPGGFASVDYSKLEAR